MNPFADGQVKQRIFDFIAAHPEGVTRKQIEDHVYASYPDGGPCSNVVHAHLWGMRDRLSRRGLAIVRNYRLVKE